MYNTKERPLCRAAIEKFGLRPFMVRGKWNGFQAVRPDGRLSHLSAGLKKQLRKMLAENRWADLCRS